MHIRPADISELTAQVPLCVRVSHPAAADHGHQPPDEACVRPRHLPRRPRQAHPGSQAQVPLLPPGTKPFGRQTDLLVLVALKHPEPVLEVREGGLEPPVGRGCDEEDGETPHRVGDGGPLDKVGQGHQHPLVEHGGLVLVAPGLVEHSKQNPGQKNLVGCKK